MNFDLSKREQQIIIKSLENRIEDLERFAATSYSQGHEAVAREFEDMSREIDKLHKKFKEAAKRG